MAKAVAQAKFVFMCAGRKNGLCFSNKNTEEMWKHIKSYRKKPGYEHVTIREVACLGICRDGPCLLVIDENCQDTEHRLGAERNNVEEAKKLLDRFMDEHVIDTTPPSSPKGCCGRGCPECAE